MQLLTKCLTLRKFLYFESKGTKKGRKWQSSISSTYNNDVKTSRFLHPSNFQENP